jgi:hypothetical protein
MTTSYWDKTGKNQKEYDALWDKLVPAEGEADTIEGELIRCIGRLFYEYCNNGNCNAATLQEVESYWNSGYDDEEEDEYDEELEIDPYYEEMIDMLESNIGSIQGIIELILDPSKHYNYSYTQKELDVYNDVVDRVLDHIRK